MQTTIYKHLLLNVIPYIRFTTYYTSLRGWKFFRGHQHLKVGDIILTVDRKKLTTLLIPGTFAHAALCVNKGVEFECAEMTHLNYTRSHFSDLCFEADRVVILRCQDFDSNYIERIVHKCKTFEDARYDIEFNLGVEQLYCSELIYQSDFEKKLKLNLDDLVGIGIPYISPDGLFKAKNCSIVWDSDHEVRS